MISILLLYLQHIAFSIKTRNTTEFWSTYIANNLNFQAEAGQIQVNGFTKGVMFYQMFSKRNRSINSPSDYDPIIVWIGGGPGISSQAAAFNQFGPLTIVNVKNKTTILQNQFSWNQEAFLVFPDLINVGFSRADQGQRQGNQTTNTADKAAQDLASFIVFYNKPLYLGGVGYGGKIALALANYLRTKKTNINKDLRGVILNGGEIDPSIQNNNFDGMLYNAGVIDRVYRDSIAWYQNRFFDNLLKRNISQAYNCYHYITQNKTNLQQYSAGISISNFRQVDSVFDQTWAIFLNQSRNNLSTDETFIWKNDQVKKAFQKDIITSYGNQLKLLLNSGIKFLLINGQNDVSVSPASTQLLANTIQWKEAKLWRKTPKKMLHLNGYTVGWQKHHANLWVTFLYDSGKLIGRDQPSPALHALTRYLYGL